MDYLLLTFGIVLIILGLLGCILPILPGPPLSFIAVLLLHYTDYANFTFTHLFILGFIAMVIYALDYVIPIWGTKKFGGSKAGVWGATLGLIIGIFFFPPFGILFGPLVGAIIAETLKGQKFSKAVVAGLGSLVGFILGVGLKLVASVIITYYFIVALFTEKF